MRFPGNAGLLAGLIAMAGFAMPNDVLGQGAATADRYWQFELAPEFAKRDRNVYFYRTRQTGNAFDVYDACDKNGKSLGTATQAADGSWVFGPRFGSLSARAEKADRLSFSLDGAAYATARGIERVQCRNGLPLKVVPMIAGRRANARALNFMSNVATATGRAHLTAASVAALPIARPPPLPTLPAVPDTSTVLANGDTYACHATPIGLNVVRPLQNALVLGPNAQLWPGALLRGASYAKGAYAPVTIPRAGGTITLSGLTFAGEGRSSFNVDVMSREAVQNGISKLLAQGTQTEANFDFFPEVVFNDDQMAYTQGTDGRFLSGMNGALHIDPASGKNYVLVRFRQTYYTAALEPPETSYSVFRDGQNFDDPENQIGANDPPLYVGEVGYGRVIYFLVSSHHDGDAMIKALNAAKDNKADEAAMSGGVAVSYSKILQDSTFAYYVQGGEASAALQDLGNGSGVANTYEAFKKLIADERLARVSETSRGVPLNYTLNYLTSRESATMGFATAYNQKSCATRPKLYASFGLALTCIDDDAKITMIGPDGGEIQVYSGSRLDYFDLDRFIPTAQRDQTYVLRLEVYNIGGPSCLDFQLVRMNFPPAEPRRQGLDRSGNMVDIGITPRIYPPPPLSPLIKLAGSWAVGWLADYRIRINRSTGEVTVTQRNGQQ